MPFFFFALSLISLSDVHFCKYLPLSAESLLYWKLLLYIYSPVLHAAKLYAWGVRHQGTVKDGFVWRPQYPSTPARLGMEWQPDSAWSPGHWLGPWRWCQDGDTDPKIWQPDLPEQGSHGVHMKCAVTHLWKFVLDMAFEITEANNPCVIDEMWERIAIVEVYCFSLSPHRRSSVLHVTWPTWFPVLNDRCAFRHNPCRPSYSDSSYGTIG